MSSSSTSSDQEKGQPVSSLNLNDVLLGRGSGSKNYIGNRRFRDIVKQYKEEYHSTNKHVDKKRIANLVLDQVRSSGGRFLHLKDDGGPVENIVREGVWYECDKKTSLEKCRQALRDKKLPAREKKHETATSTVNGAPPLQPNAAHSSISVLSQPLVPPVQPVIDPRLLLFQGNPSSTATTQLASWLDSSPPVPSPVQVLSTGHPFPSFAQQASLLVPPPQHQVASVSIHPSQPSGGAKRYPDGSNSNNLLNDSIVGAQTNHTAPIESNVVAPMNDPSTSSDDDISDYLMSVLALSGRSKFTDEQHAQERASMTNEEQAKLLCDLFGSYCSVRHSKKTKRDLSSGEIAFLVNQMKVQVNKIPLNEKEELMEAQRHAAPEEFSDARLERFLRCEGMDVKAAAKRLACYWKCRKDVFGSDHLRPLTLSEALQNDVVALEAGVLCLLPRNDLSGRTMLYLDPSRHTRDGYTSESLLRAIWYVIEVASQECNDASSRAVQMVWAKKLSLFDYESKIYDRMHYFEANAWPIRKCSFHICCPDSYTIRILKPILHAVADKESRARCLFHTVPETQLLSVLSDYGIQREMLPTDMGGIVRLDQKQWIAERRAAEMSLL